jgi:hypothetical protein
VRPISWTVGGRQSLVGCCPVQFRFFAQLVCNAVGIWVAGTHRGQLFLVLIVFLWSKN